MALMYTKALSAQNMFERQLLMNQADGECLRLFISSSGIDFVYFSTVIIVSSISGNVSRIDALSAHATASECTNESVTMCLFLVLKFLCCFIMTVLIFYLYYFILQFHYSGIMILGLIFYVWALNQVQLLAVADTIIWFKVILTLLFHIAMNSNKSWQQVVWSSGDPAENGSAGSWHSRFILWILCAAQNSYEFLTSSVSGAASESAKGKFFLLVFTPFKERWFLRMHIEQSAEEDGGGGWLISKSGQKSPVIYITVDPWALFPVARGCFVVWLPHFLSSTPSKSELRRLLFKQWEWKMAGFDCGCLYKPVGWSTGPPFPLMRLSSARSEVIWKFWKLQKSLLSAASLADACLPLRVQWLRNHNLHSPSAFRMQGLCKSVP